MTGQGLFLPEANDGARTFSSGKNDGARTFSEEKNDGAETSIHTVFFSGLFVLVALRVHSFTEQTKLVHYSGYIDNGGLKGHKKGTIADSYPFQFHLGARGGG